MLAWKTLNGEKNTWAHRLRTRSLYEKRYHRRLDGNNLELFFVQEMVTIEKLFLSLTQSLLQRLYTTNRNNILMMFCPSFYTHITLRAIYKCSLIRRTETYLQICPSLSSHRIRSDPGFAWSDLYFSHPEGPVSQHISLESYYALSIATFKITNQRNTSYVKMFHFWPPMMIIKSIFSSPIVSNFMGNANVWIDQMQYFNYKSVLHIQ